MAVTYDSVGPSSSGAGHTGDAALTWTHTTSAASTYLLVAASPDGVPTSDTTTATCDSVAMTSLGTVVSGSGGTTGYLQVWYITGIASGAHTITVTPNVSTVDITGGSIAFSGAVAVGTPATSATSATGSQYSVTLASNTNGNLIAAFAAAGNDVSATSSPATSRFVNNLQGANGDATGNIAGATSPATGSSVTVTWTGASTVAATFAVEIQGPSLGPPLTDAPVPVNIPVIVTGRAGWRNAGHSR